MEIKSEFFIEKAIKLAVKAHEGQVDKAGQPYILHCLRVMSMCKSYDAKVVAVLHDIVEDTIITLDDLKAERFPNYILDAIIRLTKDKDNKKDNMHYLNKIVSNRLAIEVKMADLKDNLNLLRLISISKEDIKRINKYIQSYNYLSMYV